MPVLTVFANQWDHLPTVVDRDDVHYHLVVLSLARMNEKVAIAFYGRSLRPDRLVVAYPVIVRRL